MSDELAAIFKKYIVTIYVSPMYAKNYIPSENIEKLKEEILAWISKKLSKNAR